MRTQRMGIIGFWRYDSRELCATTWAANDSSDRNARVVPLHQGAHERARMQEKLLGSKCVVEAIFSGVLAMFESQHCLIFESGGHNQSRRGEPP